MDIKTTRDDPLKFVPVSQTRFIKHAARKCTCRVHLLFMTSWIDKVSACAGNIYGIFIIRDKFICHEWAVIPLEFDPF